MTHLETNLAAIHGFIRATSGDLPAPDGVTTYNHGDGVHLQFDSLDDLREWAAYLQVEIVAHDVPRHRTIHHNAEATWGPVGGGFVSFRMVHIEAIPEPMPSSQYACEKCGAQFGAAGGFYGDPEDEAAEEYHREEIARHESGECVQETVAP